MKPNRLPRVLLLAVVLAALAATGAQAKPRPHPAKRHPGAHKPGKPAAGARDEQHATAQVLHADVLRWLLAHNPGLGANFLQTEPAARLIALPDGRRVELYRLKQFLDVNFRLTFYPRKPEKGSAIVATQAAHLRRLMALPAFHDWIKQHRPTYKISPRGKVSAEQAYNHFRHINRQLGVAVHKSYKAPVGGGSGIGAPSWAVWQQMNLFEHEACHCIGIGHDSGGLSGPLAGELRKWDRQRRWDYETVDVNALPLPQ